MTEHAKIFDIGDERRKRRPNSDASYPLTIDFSNDEEEVLAALREIHRDIIELTLKYFRAESIKDFSNRDILRQALIIQEQIISTNKADHEDPDVDDILALAKASGVLATTEFGEDTFRTTGLTNEEFQAFDNASREEISSAQQRAMEISGTDSFTLKEIAQILLRNRQ